MNVYERYLELNKLCHGSEYVECENMTTGERYSNILDVPVELAESSSYAACFRLKSKLDVE